MWLELPQEGARPRVTPSTHWLQTAAVKGPEKSPPGPRGRCQLASQEPRTTVLGGHAGTAVQLRGERVGRCYLRMTGSGRALLLGSLLAQPLSAQDHLRLGRRLVLNPMQTPRFSTSEAPGIPSKGVFTWATHSESCACRWVGVSRDTGPTEQVWKNIITDKGWVHHKAGWPLSPSWGFYRGPLGRSQRGWPLKVVLLLGFSCTSWLRVHVAQCLLAWGR